MKTPWKTVESLRKQRKTCWKILEYLAKNLEELCRTMYVFKVFLKFPIFSRNLPSTFENFPLLSKVSESYKFSTGLHRVDYHFLEYSIAILHHSMTNLCIKIYCLRHSNQVDSPQARFLKGTSQTE